MRLPRALILVGISSLTFLFYGVGLPPKILVDKGSRAKGAQAPWGGNTTQYLGAQGPGSKPSNK